MCRDNFFIKDGYQSYEVNKTDYNHINLNYWNQERIYLSKFYQYQVYLHGRRLINKFSFDNVLDIGCGVGTKLIETISPTCKNITGIDGHNAIEYCKNNYKLGKFIVDDLENPRSEPGEFDLIICADVIEHIKNPDNLTKFIKKCSHPNTFIIISTPERDKLRGKNCMASTKPEHIREWNKSEFREYLYYSGFEIITHDLIPFIKLSMRRKVLRILLNTLLSRWTINTTQMVVCKIQT